jgi:hypothetical protein
MRYDDTKQGHSAIDYKKLAQWLRETCVERLQRSRRLDQATWSWMAVRGFKGSLTRLDTRNRRPGFSGLADGARPLTPFVMFYKLAPKYRAYVRLTQIREFADVTGELDDNFQ